MENVELLDSFFETAFGIESGRIFRSGSVDSFGAVCCSSALTWTRFPKLTGSF